MSKRKSVEYINEKISSFDPVDPKEWITLGKEVDQWIASATKEEVKIFLDEGYGETLSMIISALDAIN